MRNVLVVTFLLGITCNAAAQQPAAPPTPEAQALAQKLMSEINSGIQCSAAAIALQQQLATTNARIKTLEDKYEPKSEEKK